MSQSITIHRMRDPQKVIASIKAIRSLTGLGLREAKAIADNVRGYNPAVGAVNPIPQTIEVSDDADLTELHSRFVVTVAIPENVFSNDPPKSLVVDLLLDALSIMTPEQAERFRRSPAYIDARKRLS